MKNHLNNAWAIIATICLLLGLNGCVHTEPMKKLVSRASTIALPREVDYNMQQSAADFGKMVRGYLPPGEPIVVEVDIIANETGISKELPKDLGIYVVNAFQRMGAPFVVTRTLPSGVSVLDNPASAALTLPPTKRPPAKIRVKGVIMRNTDRIVRTHEGRGSVSAKISGGQLSADAGADNTATVRNLRVACYLEDEEGKSIPGQMAIFEVWFGSDESSANISLYFEGSGGGYNSKVQVNQDFGDAALDASAATAICLVGKWLRLPYWRTHPLFAEDHDVEKDLRTHYSQFSDLSLDSFTKLYLFGAGRNLDVTHAEVSTKDRALMREETRKAHWRPEVREDRENFLVDLWKNLDYRAASERMDRQIALLTRAQNEKLMARTQHEPPALPRPDEEPTTTGPEDRKVVQIDFSKVTADLRKTLLEALAKVPTCEHLLVQESGGSCQLTYGGDPAVLQGALRAAPGLSGLDYFWKDVSWKTMEVVAL